MWPLERRRPVVRVGRSRLELWLPVAQGLQLEAVQELAQAEPPSLRESLAALVARGSSAALAKADLVLESAWLPVLLVPVGEAMASEAQARALVRHHVEDLHGAANDWGVDVQLWPGLRTCLGYALAAPVREALLAVAHDHGPSWSSLQPAFAWGFRRLARQVPRKGWFAWLEQDRALLAATQGGGIVALNAAVEPPASGGWTGLLQVEAFRAGLAAPGQALVAGWDQPIGAPEPGAHQVRVGAAAPVPRAPDRAVGDAA